MKGTSIIGRKSGTLTVLSTASGKIVVRCDCGRVCTKASTTIHRKAPTCGDRKAHPRPVTKHGLAGSYLYEWHFVHEVCAGWRDVARFALDVGEPPGGEHALTRTGADFAACGTCDDCLAIGATRNVEWTAGGASIAEPVLVQGERVSQAEAARRLGISREAVRQRVAKGISLDLPRGAHRGKRGKGIRARSPA